MKPFILGTRGSDLALAQTRFVASRLRAIHPDLLVEEKIIRTTGDLRLDVSLSEPGTLDKGLFTKELEEALLRGEIDAAVHSLKDLPVDCPAGLALGAVLQREDPADVLVSKLPGGLHTLSAGAFVATSSLRRKCFLLSRRPDLEVRDIRGNVPTRLRKLIESDTLSALVIARAGLNRLTAAGCDLPLASLDITPLEFMLPAPGQGAIAIECREGDADAHRWLSPIHHAETATCVQAERAVLAGLGGGCHLPLGALAVTAEGLLSLRATWFGREDSPPRSANRSGPVAEWRQTSASVVAELIS